jgi:flagellar biosynthetic protein FlhB
MCLFAYWGPVFVDRVQLLTRELHGRAAEWPITQESIYTYFLAGVKFIGILLLPLVLPLVVIAAGANVAQVGFLFTTKPLMPRLDALNPINGAKRIVSLQGLVELVKSFVKIGIIAGISFLTIRGRFDELLRLSGAPPGVFLGVVGHVALELGIRVALALAVLAVFDYAFQRWQFERSIKMSRKEIEDELKQGEGDPHVRARVRGLMRLHARRRMLADTAKADVVVTNPVHVAVALAYNPKAAGAPTVVAKGMRRMAERIKEIARAHDVPIVERPELARSLYRLAQIGDQIPVSLYRAVAEVLALVYRIRSTRIA